MMLLEPVDLSSLFFTAMLRTIPSFSPGRTELFKLNIGAGFKHIENTIVLDLPWNAETDDIPFDDNSVGVIHCYGMLDHISNIPRFMKECQRVLAPGGTMNISVAFYKSSLAFEDPYHKSWFTETTWSKLFQKQYWDPDGFEWKFRIGINLIIGVTERNLIVLTQLLRTE
jgi:SAM-dependent methyltransferase